MRFGVNYTPRSGWFHSWLHPDPVRTVEDLAAIRALGADHVRVFPLWPLLQPNRTWIDPGSVDDLMAVVDAAGDAGLRVSVDVLQGHLSSYDFLPSWVQSWHRRNLFTDPQVVAAEAELVRVIAGELAQREHADGLCLGNEFVQFAASRHPEPQVLDESGARAWLRTLLGAAHAVWPDGQAVHSFDDDVWFDDSQPFTPRLATGLGDLTTVHSWVFGGVGPRYGTDAPELVWFARYLCELAAAWGPGRAIWLQEIGAPVSYVSPGRSPDFLRRTVDALCGAGGGTPAPGLGSITWWCSHDVSRELADFPEIEYSLGLLDGDNRTKPLGEAFREATVTHHAVSAPPLPVGGAATDRSVWDVPLSPDGADRSSTSPSNGLFDDWVRSALAGDVPALRAVNV